MRHDRGGSGDIVALQHAMNISDYEEQDGWSFDHPEVRLLILAFLVTIFVFIPALAVLTRIFFCFVLLMCEVLKVQREVMVPGSTA